MAGPFGMPVVKRRQHVAPHRIVPQILLVHGVEHVRRHQDGHRGALFDVALEAGHQRGRYQRAENLFEFLQVLDRVPPLPQRRLPFFARDIAVARQSPPVRLHELAFQRVRERLLAGVHFACILPGWPGGFGFGRHFVCVRRNDFRVTHRHHPVIGGLLRTTACVHLRIAESESLRHPLGGPVYSSQRTVHS